MTMQMLPFTSGDFLTVQKLANRKILVKSSRQTSNSQGDYEWDVAYVSMYLTRGNTFLVNTRELSYIHIKSIFLPSQACTITCK